MHFYLKNLNTTKIAGAEAAHFFSLRIKEGEEVTLTDLQGDLHQVRIIESDKKKQKIAWDVLGAQKVDRPKEKILFQAWPDKQYLEKLVEVVGFSDFTNVYFFAGEHSPKQNLNLPRLEKILIRACELSQKTHKPKLTTLQNQQELQNLLQTHRPAVLEHKQNSGYPNSQTHACLVGPEGGWSPAELEQFANLQLPFQTLGQSVFPAWLAGFVWNQKVSITQA
jgi:16S rRNA (uracil1498-N3)-methyltransferase